jgi:DNA repair photolyase
VKKIATHAPLPPFSHLYIEKELLTDRWSDATEKILSRFPKATTVTIDNYAQLAQRRSASWSDQKRTPKLILGRKYGDLIYRCSDVAPDFGNENFYYAVPMQNCLYDCEYCYLQGMYTSAHMVYFINQQEMIDAAVKLAAEIGPLYICIAYDNDILAIENLLGVVTTWVEGLREHPEITVEVRTKSSNFRPLAKLVPPKNFILAWTLSPTSVIQQFEAKTPNLKARITAMREALESHWRVRLCLDPLLPVKGWWTCYRDLIDELDRQDLWSQFEDASYGLFRMPKPFLRQAKKHRPDSALLANAQSVEKRGLYTLTGTDQDQLLDFVGENLRQRMDPAKVWQT